MISSYSTGSERLSTQDLHHNISKSINANEEHLADVCKKVCRSIAQSKCHLLISRLQIHDDPELNYREYHAHDNICDLLEGLGYHVKRHTYGLETSFEVEAGQGGRLVVFNAEYDALPGLGHACGHNLIATSSIAAFIATAEALHQSGREGRVRLLGTPAEEGGGGKVRLIRAGAYEGVDACLMGHPMGCMPSNFDGVSATKSLARRQVKVTFKGQNAHAGLIPWNGKNALDAVVASYVNIALLRQQLSPTVRVHGVIRQGGAEPNIIPDSTSLEYFVRDTTFCGVEELSLKLQACFEAGALATSCGVDCAWQM
jgi:amidohydrolase